jgi:hypothetical protein
MYVPHKVNLSHLVHHFVVDCRGSQVLSVSSRNRERLSPLRVVRETFRTEEWRESERELPNRSDKLVSLITIIQSSVQAEPNM